MPFDPLKSFKTSKSKFTSLLGGVQELWTLKKDDQKDRKVLLKKQKKEEARSGKVSKHAISLPYSPLSIDDNQDPVNTSSGIEVLDLAKCFSQLSLLESDDEGMSHPSASDDDTLASNGGFSYFSTLARTDTDDTQMTSVTSSPQLYNESSTAESSAAPSIRPRRSRSVLMKRKSSEDSGYHSIVRKRKAAEFEEDAASTPAVETTRDVKKRRTIASSLSAITKPLISRRRRTAGARRPAILQPIILFFPVASSSKGVMKEQEQEQDKPTVPLPRRARRRVRVSGCIPAEEGSRDDTRLGSDLQEQADLASFVKAELLAFVHYKEPEVELDSEGKAVMNKGTDLPSLQHYIHQIITSFPTPRATVFHTLSLLHRLHRFHSPDGLPTPLPYSPHFLFLHLFIIAFSFDVDSTAYKFREWALASSDLYSASSICSATIELVNKLDSLRFALEELEEWNTAFAKMRKEVLRKRAGEEPVYHGVETKCIIQEKEIIRSNGVGVPRLDPFRDTKLEKKKRVDIDASAIAESSRNEEKAPSPFRGKGTMRRRGLRR
ncbi:hypothetical protein BT69DRAFT_1354729 [Atractiella rhizophila]|nr:hypothetical protein BT69DRAFT_1354729 [Atractiella rhizophila]